jgi:SET domain-containing protein
MSRRSKRTTTIDIANGKENLQIVCPSKYLKRLEAKFNYVDNYITTSYLTKGDMNDYILSDEYSCECEDGCKSSTCTCITTHIQKYECNNNCLCRLSGCNNRIVQGGLTKNLEVVQISDKKGFGVTTLEAIKRDEFICEYVGEIIHKEKAMELINRNQIKRSANYVLQIRENYEKIIISTFIDAEEKGNVSRFLNHSCDPNLYFDIVRVQHFIPHVAFYAIREIEVGEELTFSYCEIEAIKNDSSFNLSYKKCECGTESCIKYLPN